MTGNASDLHRYLRILAGANPAGRLIEIRSATEHGGMRQTFTPATRPDLAARTITTLAASTDVYVGVLLRHCRAGGRHACERSHLAFIETDDPNAIERLKRFAHRPTMTISSSPGHLHLYWQLQRARRPRRARASQPPPRAPPRRRPRLRRRQLASCARRPPGIENAPRQRPSSCSACSQPAATSSTSSPPTSPTLSPSAVDVLGQPYRDQRPRPATARDSRRDLRARTHRPPAQPRRQNLAAHFTTTPTPASSSTTTAGTASHAASEAPSMTSERSSSALTLEASNSYSSASASPQSYTSPQLPMP